MIRRRRQSCGFTLLEMILATGMTAVLAGSLYATLHTAFKARRSLTAALDPVRRAELALELLREDLQSAMVPRGLLAGPLLGEDSVDNSGRANDSVSVHCAVGASDQSGAPGDIRMVELVCETPDGTDQKCLVRYLTANLLASQAEEPAYEVICRGIHAFDVRYFDGIDWQDSWDSVAQGDVLPLAVEVTIQLAPDEDPPGSEEWYTASRVFGIPCSALQPGVSPGMLAAMEGDR